MHHCLCTRVSSSLLSQKRSSFYIFRFSCLSEFSLCFFMLFCCKYFRIEFINAVSVCFFNGAIQIKWICFKNEVKHTHKLNLISFHPQQKSRPADICVIGGILGQFASPRHSIVRKNLLKACGLAFPFLANEFLMFFFSV